MLDDPTDDTAHTRRHLTLLRAEPEPAAQAVELEVVKEEAQEPEADAPTPPGAGEGVTPRLTLMPSAAQQEANAVRHIGLMLEAMIRHAFTDNLSVGKIEPVSKAQIAGEMGHQVWAVRLGGGVSLLTDHPNIMRLLAPFTELHKLIAEHPELQDRLEVLLKVEEP